MWLRARTKLVDHALGSTVPSLERRAEMEAAQAQGQKVPVALRSSELWANSGPRRKAKESFGWGEG